MPISRVEVSEFGAFTQLDVAFCPGINVLIGPNATGKSHLMKLLYAVHKVQENEAAMGHPAKAMTALADLLSELFRPDSVGRLVHRRVGVNKAEVTTHLDAGALTFEISSRDGGAVEYAFPQHALASRALFIPSREGFSSFASFAALYEARELTWDRTYYDLAKALALPALRGPRGATASRLIKPLEAEIGGKVVLEGSGFYVRGSAGDFEAPLLSEGFRKIATLVRLISNGALQKHGVLFWDEPEANLNPKLARVVVSTLRTLAENGIQIFVATHDTLICQRLSLASEYAQKPLVDTRFIGLFRTSTGVVEHETAPVLSDLRHNAMLEEFTHYYDEERAAFEAALQGTAK